MTKCKRCNRKLKSEKSQERGYGGHCYLITFGKKKKEKQMRGFFYGECKTEGK